jgi:hypothetical protein
MQSNKGTFNENVQGKRQKENGKKKTAKPKKENLLSLSPPKKILIRI